MRKLALVTIPFAIAACSSKKGEPPKPTTGAPVAIVASDLQPGDHLKGSMKIEEYNFSDKRVAGYAIAIRFKDASGTVLTFDRRFHGDFDTFSYTGARYICEPTSWCSYKLELDVPPKAASAEVLATRVSSLKDDIHFDDKPLFDISSMDWPGDKKASLPAIAPSGS